MTEVNETKTETQVAATDSQVEETPLFYGRWNHHEEHYAELLIQEFRAGSLDITEGITLRGFLAKMLHCAPKRISKKFESSGYNGRMQYSKKVDCCSPEESKERLEKLEAARQAFESRRKELAKKSKQGHAKRGLSSALHRKKHASGRDMAMVNPMNTSAGLVDDASTRDDRLAEQINMAYLSSIAARTGQSLSSVETIMPAFPNALVSPRVASANAHSAIDSSSASIFPLMGSAVGTMAATGLARMQTALLGDTSMLDSILLQNSASAASATGLLTSNDLFRAGLMDHRVGALQMLAQSRAHAEQRALLQQITDQRRRAAVEAVSRSLPANSFPNMQIERMLHSSRLPSPSTNPGEAPPASKRGRYT